MSYRNECADFADVLRGEATIADENEFGKDVLKLLYNASVVQKYEVLGCNRELSEGEKSADSRATQAILDFGKKYSVNFAFEDPRGFVVKLKTPKTRKTNNMGGEDWGVPYNIIGDFAK